MNLHHDANANDSGETGPARSRRRSTSPHDRNRSERPRPDPTTSDDDDSSDDGIYHPPPASRPRLTTVTPCCSCSRYGSCKRANSGSGTGCECVRRGRCCVSCACFATRCSNRPAPLRSPRGSTSPTGSILPFLTQPRDPPSSPTTRSTPNTDPAGDTSLLDASTPGPADDAPLTPPEFPAADLQPQPPVPETGSPNQHTTRLPQPAAASTTPIPPAPGIADNPPAPATAATPTTDATGTPPPPPVAPADNMHLFPADEGADLPGYVPTPADELLDLVFGDHAHANDGSHLTGDIADDGIWLRRWRRLVAFTPTGYEAPKGAVGKRFINLLAAEWDGVLTRKWNSERPLVFAMVILQVQQGVRSSSDIRSRLSTRMDLWEQGYIAALVDDTIVQMRMRQSGSKARDDESKARAYNARVLSGRLRSAVRNLTDRQPGGVMLPTDHCTKSGQLISDVLRAKHPALRDPGPDLGRADTAFEPYESGPPSTVPIEMTADVVELVASRLSGSAGPCGTDSVTLANWLLRYGEASERLRWALAKLGYWLANGHPPWAAYRALRACRLVALDKEPGTRPVGIGESYSRLLAKCVLHQVGLQATDACGSLNLCAGLKAGIEGAVHAMSSLWDEMVEGQPPSNLPTPPAPAEPSMRDDSTAGQASTDARDDENPWGGILVDADNGFNELSRKAMLWTVRHLWPAGARMAFNAYRHAATLVLRGEEGHVEFLLSCEGVTQGDPLAMVLYGIALVPLSKNLRDSVPEATQPWYADDYAIGARGNQLVKLMELLNIQGPRRGYFPNAAKSIVLCAPRHRARLQSILQDFNFQYADGHRYVGGFIGSETLRGIWVEKKVTQWVQAIRDLTKVAKRFPQTAYAGLTKSLQMEWIYLQRVLPNLEDFFEPVERVLVDEFLPALFGTDPGSDDSIPHLRGLLAMPCRHAGLGIPNPCADASDHHENSKKITSMVSDCIRNGQDLQVAAYLSTAARLLRQKQQQRDDQATINLETYVSTADVATKRRIQRSTECSAWLTTMPSRLNGTELSATEFRDALRLRYGLKPSHLPSHCDGCGSPFTVEHAMSCRRGGLVIHRHDDVAGEWHQLCATALTPTRVTDEPIIPQSRITVTGPNGQQRTVDPPERRGDVAAHGFWQRGVTTIFDIRVTDTDARSYRNTAPTKVLEKQEKEKKTKYLDACKQARRHFTPLVFSVDGLRAKETIAACQHVARLLSVKWTRPYSQVAGMVRSRMNIALVRAASRCLRDSRDPDARNPALSWIAGSGLRLFR